jgi:hypothetical protein
MFCPNSPMRSYLVRVVGEHGIEVRDSGVVVDVTVGVVV